MVQVQSPPAYLDALRTLPNLDILLALAGLLPSGDLSDALDKDLSNIREFAVDRMVLSLDRERRLRTGLAEAFRQAPTTWLQSRRRKLLSCHRAHLVGSRQIQDQALQAVIIPYACNTPACPTCSRSKSLAYFFRAYAALSKKLDGINHLSHLVCTVRNCPWGTLEDTLTRLLIAWQRFQHSAAWLEHVHGFFWGLEITINRRTKTWHPHIHALLHAEYWPKDQVKATWRKLLGRQRLVGNTHIKAATSSTRTVAQAIHECTKYITPGFEEPGTAPEQLWELATSMHRIRRKGSGKTMRIPGRAKPDVPFHIHGGLKALLERAQTHPDSVLIHAVVAAIWANRATLLEVATSYPATLWAIAPRKKKQ